MKYQFDVELQVRSNDCFNSEEEADAAGEKIGEQLLAGSLLAKEYPDWDFEVLPQTSSYQLRITFTFKLLFDALSLEEAKGEIDWKIHEMLAGSRLAESYRQEEPVLSDEQPGLDELLSWIDEDEPFCIVADANQWHLDCARVAYGEQAIRAAIKMSERYGEETILSTEKLYERYPQDSEGNLLHVVYGREWIQDVRNAWANAEEIPASCACLNSLYDEPRKDEA